jgi:hypothetical protein
MEENLQYFQQASMKYGPRDDLIEAAGGAMKSRARPPRPSAVNMVTMLG